MTNHPWEISAYAEQRYTEYKSPDMIYLPSVELLQKMILASAKNKYGKIVTDENDILERFISTEKDAKTVKIRKARGGQKEQTIMGKQLETYARENQTFKAISEFEKLFKTEDVDVDLSKVAQFIPSHKTNKLQKKVRGELWDHIDDNGNGLLSLGETKAGIFSYFKDHQAILENERRHQLIQKAFNLAKDFFPCSNKKSKKKKKVSVKDKYIERIEFRVFLIALRQRFEYFQAFKVIDTSGDGIVEIQEFIKAKDLLEKWVGVLTDPWEDFRTIDTDGSGSITFDEFCDWSIHKNLDLDGPDDSDGGEAAEEVPPDEEEVPSDCDPREYHYDDGL